MHETALSLPVVLPEAVLALGTLLLVLFGALRGERAYNLVTEISVALLGIVFLIVVWKSRPMGITFYGAFADDPFTRFMSGLALIGSLVTLLLSLDFMRRERIGGFEFPVLILLSTLGMLMLIAANDFIALYLGLELMSLALYVIAAYRRHDLRSTEAGLKYFVLGALSSGMLLYGASLIYGYAGSVRFSDVAAAVHDHHNIGVLFGLVFVLAGLAFKISAVPFHMWTPDVYEGAPTPVTTFFASAPKIAAMAVLVRVAFTAFPGIASDWRQILTFVSIASMALGAFAAIGQTNIKRLMAYSSIGHMGFALVGLAAGTVEGAQSVIVYMAIYVVMTLGHLRRDPVDAAQRQGRGDDLRPRRPRPHRFDDGVLPGDDDVLACRRSAARRLLRQVLCVRRGHQGRPLRARGHRRAGERGGRLLLSAHRQADVFRRARRGVRPAGRRRAERAGARGRADHRLRVRPVAADQRGDGGGANAVLSIGSTRGAAQSDWRVERLEAVNSTNEEARRRGLAGDPGRLWIVAGEQSAGRGRRGRTWVSPKGNLHASALLINPCPQALAPQLGFVAGVALARAAEDCGAADARLKWPNDLVRAGAKCAGLLVEGAALSDRRMACVVGIGVDCVEAPADVGYPTAVLARRDGGAIAAPDLFERLRARFAEALDLWAEGEAFARDSRANGWRGPPESGRLFGSTTPAGRGKALSRGLTPTAECCFAGRPGSRRSKPRTSGYRRPRMARPQRRPPVRLRGKALPE